MARYNKKRVQKLKHDKFREGTLKAFERLGDRLEGKGSQVLYYIGGIAALALLIWAWSWWSAKHANEAYQALGLGVEISTATVTPSPVAGSATLSFATEQERSTRAVEVFQAIAEKYGDPYRSTALYFKATNLLTLDRAKGVAELQSLTKNGDSKIATLSKFALAQAIEGDGQLDQAAALYTELAKQNSEFVPADSANLRLATIYDKQGKKQEAADILFTMIKTARETKGADNKPAPQSASVREASTLLQKVDSTRFAQLPAEPSVMDIQ